MLSTYTTTPKPLRHSLGVLIQYCAITQLTAGNILEKGWKTSEVGNFERIEMDLKTLSKAITDFKSALSLARGA